MQTKLLNYIKLDSFYIVTKRVFEIFISLFVLVLGMVFYMIFFFRKILSNKEIYTKKQFFLDENNQINLSFFNTNNIFIKSMPLYYFVLISKISLVGVALVKYNENIKYKVNHKPGVFSLWFIRANSKIANINISSCNKEYISNQSFFSDLSILCKGMISLLYFSKTNKSSKTITIFDITFNNLAMNEILEIIKNSIHKKDKKSISFINADCLNKTFSNNEYKQTLAKADLVLPDGSGINIACNILKQKLKENVNGTDMLPHICSLSQENSFKIFLLGAKDGVALKAKEKLLEKYPNLQIVGTAHGYINHELEQTDLINKINSSKANILLVAMGAPMQEIFIEKYKNQLNSNVIIGVGGLFDFYSSNIKRAPMYLRETGFEWVYRMIQEPKRMWKRYILGNPLFIYRVLRYKKQLQNDSLIDNYLNTYDKPKKLNLQKIIWKLAIVSRNFLKRSIDVLASFILMILFSPLFLIVAIIIKLTSKGDVFFVQDRVGLNGKIFKMFKFRSMVVDAEELKEKLKDQNQSKDGVIFKMKDDPRITKIGKFIRKTSIDELPQLANVFLGNMSLVGPRPPVIDEVKLYNMDDKKRLDAKPGITCIWQVSGRSSIPFKEQVQMDKEYIKTQSLLKDIVLLLKTIPAVLFQKGSY